MVNFLDVFGPYVTAAELWFEANKRRLTAEGYSERQLTEAVELFKELTAVTADEYFAHRSELFRDLGIKEKFRDEIRELQNNVLKTGKIEGVSEEFGMSLAESAAQCLRANSAFTLRPDLEKLLSDWNYSFFTGRTMATAEDMLTVELTRFYTPGMAHLSASNAAIGFATRSYILNLVSCGETAFTISDFGSGSGATLAGIILGLSEADKLLEKEIEVLINSVEACHAFYEALEKELVPGIMHKTKDLRNIRVAMNLEYGDVQKNITALTVSGVQIYTLNYLLHRLSDASKEAILGKIGARAGKDAVIFVGDMGRNSSEMPNRRYFNLAINGPLNPGNDPKLLEGLMRQNGFPLTIREDYLCRIEGIPPNVVGGCISARDNLQGFFMAGYKGVSPSLSPKC